ncbi:hypothetical protein AGR7C_Lc130031 [Agrobacterium deltaense Zutra 3/1]|uniref:Uncharacterized protein n=1 Tax=Agrobacterium deltaense Zutra 3/1 TaxID=1183427 RepID=A0A1S7R736_9HYPH|nr:hypothetical protein AGR7C_Lc130031 [Agrobacterium deltaense Zutra 3/1]
MIGAACIPYRWIRCGRSRTIGNAETRTIRNAIPVLSGTLTARICMNPKADSGSSNLPNIESFGFYLTLPAKNRVVEGLLIFLKSWTRVPLILERPSIWFPIEGRARGIFAVLYVGRAGR